MNSDTQQTGDSFETELKACAGCGVSHVIKFSKLDSPVQINGGWYDYAGTCMNGGFTIYAAELRVIQTKLGAGEP